MRETSDDIVWVFNGDGATFPSGVFRKKDAATEWIKKNALTGVLTAYPLDEGTLDWAIKGGTFVVKSEKQRSAEFIQKFTSGAQIHIHFEHGNEC